MAGWKDFREIAAWQYARDLKIRVDEYLERPNVKAKYKLHAQLHDTVRSGPSNIAEGFGKYGNKEFARYARIAKGSEVEVLNHLNDALGTSGTPWNLWNRVDCACGRPRPAPKNPRGSEVTTAAEAVLFDRFFPVVTAGQGKAATDADPFVKRGERCLIQVDAADCGSRRPLIRWRAAKIERDCEDD